MPKRFSDLEQLEMEIRLSIFHQYDRDHYGDYAQARYLKEKLDITLAKRTYYAVLGWVRRYNAKRRAARASIQAYEQAVSSAT